MMFPEKCLTGQTYSNNERKFQFSLAFQIGGYDVDI